MANDQTYNSYGNDGGQTTTLANIQGNGLSLPIPTSEFINIRRSGRIQELFESGNNSNILYSLNRPDDLYLQNGLASRFDYKNPTQGQQSNKPSTIFRAALQDSTLVQKFIGSNNGSIFIRKQLVLQGFQAFDETKVYNPLSPRIASARLATYGILGRPTRHIDTSNVVSGLLGATGLSNAVGAVSGVFGGGPSQPSPPRSSVASSASQPGGFLGISASTFTSLLGGGDKTDEVMPFIAKDGVKGLLRGGTATSAYFNSRYARLINKKQGFLSKIGAYFQNTTLIGGIFPPKQPWKGIKYRADENTYDNYFENGKLFFPSESDVKSGGILSGLKKAFGFGGTTNYKLSVPQRFVNSFGSSSNPIRLIITGNKGKRPILEPTSEYGELLIGTHINSDDIISKNLKSSYTVYEDLFAYANDLDYVEYSDQLLNYKLYTDDSNSFKRTHSDKVDLTTTEHIIDVYNRALSKITGPDSVQYTINDSTFGIPLQYSKFNSKGIGFDQLKDTISSRNSRDITEKSTYLSKVKQSDRDQKYPSRIRRKIRPTNSADDINKLTVLSKNDFDSEYLNKNSGYGADLIKFYFYDIVNEMYIPFNATIKGITDSNSATIDTIDYIGRADKLYTYKGYTRSVAFNFKVVAHSVQELIPMWKRISYLVGLTRPSGYTGNNIGYIIPPLITFTIGDLYKDQFAFIDTCAATIDENAIWELLPEDKSSTDDWTYGLNNAISWKDSKSKYAQLPKECDISITTKIIEKKVARVGNSVWGSDTLTYTDNTFLA